MRCLTILVFALGCTGSIGNAGGSTSDPDNPRDPEPPTFDPRSECENPEDAFVVPQIRRLSNAELSATLGNVFPAGALNDVQIWLDGLPPDITTHTPGEFQPEPTQGHIDATFETVTRLADVVAESDEYLSSVAPACMLDAPDTACVESMVRNLGARLIRRPLTEGEVMIHAAEYEQEVAVGRERVSMVLASLLTSPELLFHVVDAREQMSAHEVAARISYGVAGTTPDAELQASADADELQDVNAREAHARRMIESTEGRRHVRELFRRWLGLHGRRSPESAATLAQVPVDGLYDELVDEALDFVEHVVFEERGTFHDLMTSSLEFPSTDRLAAILGEERTDEAVPSTKHRAGLLTRPAVLISDNARTSPIIRGVFIWERFLCADFPAPPSNADDIADENLTTIDPDFSTSRTRASTMTGTRQCQSCHTAINAPGFALARFGPLGEEWDAEVVYDAPGDVLAELALDGDDEVTMEVDGSLTDLVGANELGELIAGSDEGRSCAALQVFRATHLREATLDDACHLQAITESFDSNTPILDILVLNVARETTALGDAR